MQVQSKSRARYRLNRGCNTFHYVNYGFEANPRDHIRLEGVETSASLRGLAGV